MTEKSGSGTQNPELVSDDNVLPFYAELAGVNGRLVRLGGAIDDLLNKHDYPEPVSQVLGEAVALVAMIGSAMKFDGKLILQTKSDGPVGMLVVQFTTPEAIRGYASFDQEKLDQLVNGNGLSSVDLLGKGHLALTVDQGADMDLYQGIVALEGKGLSAAAHNYFEQSEQLKTFVKVAVARHYVGGSGDDASHMRWRAGGLMVQDLTSEGGRAVLAKPDIDEDDIEEADDDGWNRAYHLASTVKDHELLDPLLAPEQLIYRLFHEERVRVFPDRMISSNCNCSREHLQGVISRFSSADLDDMVENGVIEVKCEFCSEKYQFERNEFQRVSE